MRDELNWKVLVGIVALFVVVTVMFSNCTGSNYDEITADQYAEVVKLSEACPSVLAISKNLMEVGRIVKKDYEKIIEAGEECKKDGKAKSDAAKIKEQKDKLLRMMNNQ
ncbi:hypothetical protein [Fundidesulfovibrio putealis]|uniref:hypothetical protein n=1 Tax=Fundidesulfovibrio putealis TaxID=270496 RepID=UPI0004828CDA|nr:hypothetical protein [Fundidesulfovibrio putealis]KAF0234877.1 MAG: hypothetical protein FD177_440 [Desulfovibrionaceae bacterium]